MMRSVPAQLLFGALLFGALLFGPAAGATGLPQALDDQLRAIYPDVESLYVDLHRNPELAFNEHTTARKLAERVKALGYEVTTGVGGTGVVAILRNGEGPTVMLRTDLDALPVQEKTGLPFASQASGINALGEKTPVMHACGHDLHMSAWYGTARLMAGNRARWHGTLMLVGQPAEETGLGSAAMLKDGLFTRFPKPDYALSFHDEPALPSGQVGYHAGYFRAGSDTVAITIFGQGGHGAVPQTTIDPIVIAARTILALQTIVSRETNPLDPVVITVGSIHGGSQANIIPDQVKLQVTVRTFEQAVRERVLAAIAREVKGEALAANAPREPSVEVVHGVAAVYNDPELTERMTKVLREVMGPRGVAEMQAKMTSEDFTNYAQAGVKSVLLHVGAVDPAQLDAAKKSGIPLPGLHSPQWAPDYHPAIVAAVTAETSILIDLLNDAKPQGKVAKPGGE